MCHISWNMLPVIAHLTAQMIFAVTSEQSDLNLTNLWTQVKSMLNIIYWLPGRSVAPKPSWWLLSLEQAIIDVKNASWVIQHALQQRGVAEMAAVDSQSLDWQQHPSQPDCPPAPPVTAAAVTSSITQSAGVTVRIWRRGGITTQCGIHPDCPDQHPSVLAAAAPWIHSWFRDGWAYSHSYVYGAPCERSHVRVGVRVGGLPLPWCGRSWDEATRCNWMRHLSHEPAAEQAPGRAGRRADNTKLLFPCRLKLTASPRGEQTVMEDLWRVNSPLGKKRAKLGHCVPWAMVTAVFSCFVFPCGWINNNNDSKSFCIILCHQQWASWKSNHRQMAPVPSFPLNLPL